MIEPELDKLSIQEIYQKIDQNQIEIGLTNLECQAFFEKLCKKAEEEKDQESLENIKKDYFLFLFQKSLTKEYIEYYRKRFKETKNLILKVKYCEALIKEKLDFNVISHTFDSYLKLAEKGINASNNALARKMGIELLERSIILALKLKNDDLIDKSISKHFELLEELEKSGDFSWIFFIIKSLFNLSRKLWEKIDTSRIEYYIKNGMGLEEKILFSRWEDWSILLVQFYSLQGDKKKKRKIIEKIANMIENNVDDLVGKGEINSALASYYYRKVNEYREKIGGLSDELYELKNKIAKHQKLMEENEMINIQGSFEVPKREIDAFLSQFEGKTITNIISIICSLPLISYDVCKKAATQILGRSIIAKIQNQLYVDGLLKSETSEEKTIELQAKWMHINEHFLLFLKIALLFENLEKEGVDFYSELLEFFQHNDLITEENMQFIDIGIQKFRENDYLGAIHILIFQCEAILRGKLKRIGIPDFYIKQDIQKLIPLGGVLRRLREHDAYPENLLKLLEHYLSDQQSYNLRNKIAHGLAKIEDMTRINCVALIFFLFRLTYNK